MSKILIKASLVAAVLAFTAQSAAFANHPKKDDMFAEQDANKDGKITKDEAAIAAQKHFDAADANKDSVLTKEEVKAHHGKKHKEHKNKRTHSNSGDTLDNKDVNADSKK